MCQLPDSPDLAAGFSEPNVFIVHKSRSQGLAKLRGAGGSHALTPIPLNLLVRISLKQACCAREVLCTSYETRTYRRSLKLHLKTWDAIRPTGSTESCESFTLPFDSFQSFEDDVVRGAPASPRGADNRDDDNNGETWTQDLGSALAESGEIRAPHTGMDQVSKSSTLEFAVEITGFRLTSSKRHYAVPLDLRIPKGKM